MLFHKEEFLPPARWQAICWSFLGNVGMTASARNLLDENLEYRRLTIWSE